MDNGSDAPATVTEAGPVSQHSGVTCLDEITFDEQDKNLFLVNDPRLRADALRYSILPRMHVVLREAVSLIRQVYGVNAFDDSTVSCFPNFRQKRERELALLYDSAFVGLGGQREKGKWPGVKRRDDKPVQIVPFRYAFTLNPSGVGWSLNNWLRGLSDESNRALLTFVADNLELIQPLCIETGMYPQVTYGGSVRYLSPLRDQYRHMMENRHFDNHFFIAPEVAFPVDPSKLFRLIRKFILFFPVYDSFIQIAKGNRPRFAELLCRANDWLEAGGDHGSKFEAAAEPKNLVDFRRVAEMAEQRVPVLPAMRWRVFQQDHWRCVACGLGAHDGVILHVDHILPRSKGGPDSFDNYQTLCSLCNGGKSNRDATDLRQFAADKARK